MRISDWSSDVCSSDLEKRLWPFYGVFRIDGASAGGRNPGSAGQEAGRRSARCGWQQPRGRKMGGQPRSPAGGALEADPAAMQFDQRAAQRQSKSRPLHPALHLSPPLHYCFLPPFLVRPPISFALFLPPPPLSIPLPLLLP